MVVTPKALAAKQEATDYFEQAVKDVEVQIGNDQKFPSLDEQLLIGTGHASFSGVNDFDYPSVTFGSDIGLLRLEKQLASVKRVPLPDELVEQFTHMQCNCAMGIFPEISRGWLAIDSDLYFWIFEDGSDVAYFDGLKEIILTAGLVRPKPGIFQDHIHFLLCITTPTNIHLLGVTFAENEPGTPGRHYGTIHLHPEPLFTVASDNVYMTSVSSTASGRIFLAGKDGCVYELIYQAQSSWFSRKAYKVNHTSSRLSFLMPSFVASAFTYDDPICQLAVDNTRGVLYCRTGRGNIQVYDLGEDMSGMKLVCSANEASISYNAQYAARTIDRGNFQKIVHIAPIPKTDSYYIHVVAITETGVRLYFTTTSVGYPGQRPNQLKLVHVRMPPGYAPSSAPEKPGLVHSAYYRQGTSILAASYGEDTDALWCFSQDTYPFKQPIKETQASVRIEGRTWCLMEVLNHAHLQPAPYHLFTQDELEPPAIATQHVLPARRFVLLSAHGSHIITTLRPVEQLQTVLSQTGSGECEAVEAFFKLYGEEQACATCLAIICQSRESDPDVRAWATQAFFRYGSDLIGSAPTVGAGVDLMKSAPALRSADPMASYLVGSPAVGGSSQGSFLATPVAQGHQVPVRTPAPPKLDSTASRPTFSSLGKERKWSGKYQGLLLYFVRVVKPLWAHPMTNEVVAGKISQLWSRLSSDDLSWFLERLYKLRQFVESYCDVHNGRSPSFMHRYALVSQGSHDALQREKADLKAFHQLLVVTIEALELWRILCDHQLHIVVSEAPADIKDKLKYTCVRDLFSPAGRELSGTLINLLMSKYLHDSNAVDSLSQRLRETCPAIYSADDALYTKANEVLLSVSAVSDQTEKEKILQEAIHVYMKVPDLLDLNWICVQLRESHYYPGIVDLCLSIALKRDPQGVALHYYKCGEPRADLEGADALAARQEAYVCILENLNHLLQQSVANASSPSLPTRPGPPAPPTAGVLPPDMAQKLFENMLLTSLKSGDELFHISVYDWLIQKKLTNRLLEIPSSYLEQYLIKTATRQHPNNFSTLDLLWRYYEKRRSYIAAAKILQQLAERDGQALTINDRLEYLSRAVMSAKSCSSWSDSSADGELLHDIEEKLDVARVQLKIYEHMLNLPQKSQEVQDALSQLNSKLLNISVLYGDYAEKFNLPECKLEIIHCANHNDATLVEKIWMEIVGKVFDSCRHLSATGQMNSVRQHLIAVGRDYSGQERFFPLTSLIYSLERRACELAWEPSYVFGTLEEMGVQFSALFQAYTKLYKSKELCWSQLGRPLHVLSVLSSLFLHFFERPPSSGLEKMTLMRAMYEATIGYVVDLNAMELDEPDVQQLLSRFKGVEARLKRLL